MKTLRLVSLLSVLAFLRTQAQIVATYGSGKRSAHETVWQRVEWQTNETGRVITLC
jgi:hypothetical protein